MYELQDLFKAVKENDIELVKRILAEKPGLKQATDVDDWTPLHYAAAYNATDVAELLVQEHHVNINAYSAGCDTPAMIAAQKNKILCLKKLYELGADMSLVNLGGMDVISFLSEHDRVLEVMLNKASYEADLSSGEEGELLVLIGNHNIPYSIESH